MSFFRWRLWSDSISQLVTWACRCQETCRWRSQWWRLSDPSSSSLYSHLYPQIYHQIFHLEKTYRWICHRNLQKWKQSRRCKKKSGDCKPWCTRKRSRCYVPLLGPWLSTLYAFRPVRFCGNGEENSDPTKVLVFNLSYYRRFET